MYCMWCKLERIIMTRKAGSPRQLRTYNCEECDFVAKKYSSLIFHAKEVHGIEL